MMLEDQEPQVVLENHKTIKIYAAEIFSNVWI